MNLTKIFDRRNSRSVKMLMRGAAASGIHSFQYRSFTSAEAPSMSKITIGHNVPKQMKFMEHNPDVGPTSLHTQVCEVPAYNP